MPHPCADDIHTVRSLSQLVLYHFTRYPGTLQTHLSPILVLLLILPLSIKGPLLVSHAYNPAFRKLKKGGHQFKASLDYNLALSARNMSPN